MNGNSFLLDTNIVIYLLQGDATLAEILDNKDANISFITELELYGFRNLDQQERTKIDLFLSECSIIDIHPEIKQLVIELRNNHKIKLPDAIVAATALYLDIPLITADKGFLDISNLTLVFYEK